MICCSSFGTRPVDLEEGNLGCLPLGQLFPEVLVLGFNPGTIEMVREVGDHSFTKENLIGALQRQRPALIGVESIRKARNAFLIPALIHPLPSSPDSLPERLTIIDPCRRVFRRDYAGTLDHAVSEGEVVELALAVSDCRAGTVGNAADGLVVRLVLLTAFPAAR
jgi:hypothetical protein